MAKPFKTIDTTLFDEPIVVPYRSIGSLTLVTGDTTEAQPMVPPFVTHIGNGNPEMALLSLRRELQAEILDLTTVLYPAWTGFVRTCSGLATDEYSIGPDGEIIFNQTYAEERATDQDGDWASIIRGKTQSKSVSSGRMAKLLSEALQCEQVGSNADTPVKFPVTKTITNLRYTKWSDKNDRYYSLSLKNWWKLCEENPDPHYTEEDAWKMFDKNHEPGMVGIFDNAHDCAELYDSRHMDYESRSEYLFSNEQRFIDIEVGQLKAVRKEDGVTSQTSPILLRRIRIKPQFLCGLSSKSVIMRRNPDILMSTDDVDIVEHVERLKVLDIEFDEPEILDEYTPPTERRFEQPYFNNDQPVQRLMKLGILASKDIPHLLQGFHASLFLMVNANGEPVALIDTKRGGSVGYSFRIPPVIWYRDGKLMISNPEDYMNRALSTVDLHVRRPDGSSAGAWPRNLSDLERYPVKGNLTQLAIQKFVASFGFDVVESESLNAVGKSLVSQVVAVDYSTYPGTKREFMEKIVTAMKAKFGMYPCFASGKGKSPDIRKYPLTKDLSPIWVKGANVNPRRSGNILSQLMRSLKLKETFTVAVVSGTNFSRPRDKGNWTQVLITPSGIEKQKLEHLLMERATTYIDLDDDNSLVDFTTTGIHHRLNGTKVLVYMAPPKPPKRIGKLIDEYGNKFVPGATSQATIGSIPVDLILPIQELLSKDTAHHLLRDAKEAVMHWNGKTITVLLIQMRLFRTASPSENLESRKTYVRCRGVEGHGIRAATRRGGAKPIPIVQDPSYAIAVQQCIHRVKEITGLP